jgi:hypothetical protein
MNRYWQILAMLLGGLLLAGCATPNGYGNGYGDPYGGGYGSNPNDPYYPQGSSPYGNPYGNQYGSQYGSQRVIATVQDIDPRNGRMLLAVNDSRGYAQSRIEVYFDNSTRLYYQGRQYPMAGLERGDQISVDTVQSNGRLWARQVEVVRNVRDSGGYRY